MKAKNKLFLIIVFILILINVYSYILPYFKNSSESIIKENAEMSINSQDLVKSFQKDEKLAAKLYSGKVIEVTGTIKEFSFLNGRTTLILTSEIDNFGVICDINTNELKKINQLKKNQKIRVKGICKGYLKDVILLNCSIDFIPNE